MVLPGRHDRGGRDGDPVAAADAWFLANGLSYFVPECRREARDALRAGEASPDVYLASRRDLTFLREEGYATPVDELLDERSVEFGDGYSRDALEAFSADTRLQCMPFGVSPMVIYRNTDLVDFERMVERMVRADGER